MTDDQTQRPNVPTELAVYTELSAENKGLEYIYSDLVVYTELKEENKELKHNYHELEVYTTL